MVYASETGEIKERGHVVNIASTDKQEETSGLIIELKNKKPVELFDLTNSFYGVASEYTLFVGRECPALLEEEIKLYIKDIKSGSIWAELVNGVAPLALPFIEHTTAIVSFAGYLKTGYDYLLGKTNSKPDLTKINYENLSKILEPVAKDSAAQFNIGTLINDGQLTVLSFDSVDANAIQNAITRELRKLKVPITGIKEKVLLYWYQARNDTATKAGDKSIIESIFPSPVKTIINTEDMKTKMFRGEENPFLSAYIVDVVVETIEGKPALYRVTDFYERFEKPQNLPISPGFN